MFHMLTTSESYGEEQIARDEDIPCLLRVSSSLDLHDHPFVTTSTIVLQTKASCLPPYLLLLGTNPNQQFDVIDATAAPGNKTTFLGDLLRERGTVFAFDHSESRYRTLVQRCESFGSGNVMVMTGCSLD